MSSTHSSLSKTTRAKVSLWTTFVKVSMWSMWILTLTPFSLFWLLNIKEVFGLFVCWRLHWLFFQFLKTLSLKTFAKWWIHLFNNLSFDRNYFLFWLFGRISLISILLFLYFLYRLLWWFNNLLLWHFKVRRLHVIRRCYGRRRPVVKLIVSLLIDLGNFMFKLFESFALIWNQRWCFWLLFRQTPFLTCNIYRTIRVGKRFGRWNRFKWLLKSLLRLLDVLVLELCKLLRFLRPTTIFNFYRILKRPV